MDARGRETKQVCVWEGEGEGGPGVLEKRSRDPHEVRATHTRNKGGRETRSLC